MTNKSITPSLDLIAGWALASPEAFNDDSWAYEMFIAHHAAQWGAAQELEACCTEISFWGSSSVADKLRVARKSESPSLKERSLALLDRIQATQDYWELKELDVIRRALEELDK